MSHEQLHDVSAIFIRLVAGIGFLGAGIFAEVQLKDGTIIRTKWKRVLLRTLAIVIGVLGIWSGLRTLWSTQR